MVVHKREYIVETKGCKKVGLEEYHALPNILFKRVLEHMEWKRMGQGFYDRKNPLNISDAKISSLAKIYPGVISEISLRKIGNEVTYYLSLDPTYKVMSSLTIFDMISKGYITKQNAPKKLAQKRVTTTYNLKTYYIEEIDWSKSPNSTFSMTNPRTGEKEEVKFVDYYYKTLHQTIENMKQPLIRATGRSKMTIYLIPEFCVLAEVPKATMTQLPRITSIAPRERTTKIQTLLSKLFDADPKHLLENYGLKLDKNLEEVQGNKLSTPSLILAPNSEIIPNNGDWRKSIPNIKFSHITVKRKIHISIVMASEEKEGALRFWGEIESELEKMKAPFSYDEKKPIYEFSAKSKQNIRNLDDACEHVARDNKQYNPSEVVVIAFVSDDVDYRKYRSLCLDHGYIGQAINVSPVKKVKWEGNSAKSIKVNIALQIINKFGHPSWWLNMSKIPHFPPTYSKKQFLFIGIDVFHASTILTKDGVYQKCSVAAFIAQLVTSGKTMNYCNVENRDAGAEIQGQRTKSSHASSSMAEEERGAPHLRQGVNPDKQQNLGQFVEAALKHFGSTIQNDNLVVIVYRDGVADNQMDEVDKAEVSLLKDVLPPQTHFIYMIVQKRVHNRFVMSSNDGSSYGNVAPGTVIEDLARPNNSHRHNFFLVPCTTTLSTNKPVHYTITYNSHPDLLSHQNIYGITWANHHTYQNWAGTVKVPGVCQYAHKLAYTFGEAKIPLSSVHKDLQNTLFYL